MSPFRIFWLCYINKGGTENNTFHQSSFHPIVNGAPQRMSPGDNGHVEEKQLSTSADRTIHNQIEAQTTSGLLESSIIEAQTALKSFQFLLYIKGLLERIVTTAKRHQIGFGIAFRTKNKVSQHFACLKDRKYVI